jgi:hypothetical protein
MTTQQVATAVTRLKDAVLADPDLRKIAETVRGPEDLARLWSNDKFRNTHDALIAGITTDDVRSYLSELSDHDLERVSGGAQVDYYSQFNLPAVQMLSSSQMYSVALHRALVGV